MSDERRITRRRRTPRPALVHDAVTRGQMAKSVFDELGILVSDFADATGIARSTLQGYLAGRQDIANMTRANAHRFLSGLGISDQDAWDLFAIPVAARDEWRSNRPAPLGAGGHTGERTIEHVTLDDPLFGEMSLPAGTTVYYAPGGTGRYYLMQLADDQLFALRTPAAPAGARVLGAIVNAQFDPPPATLELPSALKPA